MLRARRLLVVACAALLLVAGSGKTGVDAVGEVQGGQPTPQSGIDPLVLKSLQWRSIGPARGGRSIAVSGVKGRPKEAYFGAVGGGLWKTVDGGENWAPVTDGQIRSASVGAVAVSESNPDIVLSAELGIQTDRLQQVLSADLPAFNAESERLGLGALAGK